MKVKHVKEDGEEDFGLGDLLKGECEFGDGGDAHEEL